MASTRTHEHGHEHGHDHTHRHTATTAAAPPVVKPSIIICAFPCTGKEDLVAQKHLVDKFGYHDVVDVDSTRFPKSKHPDASKRLPLYVQEIIREASTPGRVIIASTHEEIRVDLESQGKHFGLVYPDPRENLKKEYLQRQEDAAGGIKDETHDFMEANWDTGKNITKFAVEDAGRGHHRGVALRAGERIVNRLEEIIRKAEHEQAAR